MASVTAPAYSFVNGTVPSAANFNANPLQFVAAINNIDNTNIGAAGIFASQMKPGSASQATFGGAQTYTFPAGITMNGNLTGAIFSAFSGTTGTFSGLVTANGGEAILGGTPIALSSPGFLQIGSTAGENVIYDYQGIQALVGGATFTLALQQLGGGVTSKGGYIPPVYTSTGAATASTLHIATGTTTFASLANNSTTSNVITLSGAAVFTGLSSYFVFCTVSGYSGAPTGGGITTLGSNSSGSQFSVSAFNTTGGTLTTVNVSWIAIGT